MEQLLRQRAESIWTAAIRSVLPDEAVRRALEHFHPQGRVFLVAAGKAAWQMAHAALAVLVALLLVMTPVGDMLLARFEELGTQSGLRLSIWHHTLSEMASQPWLGRGFSYELDFINYSGEHITTTHSVYMGALLKGGIVGLLLLLAIIACGLWQAWRKRHTDSRYSLAILFYALVFMASQGMFIISNPRETWVLFWLPLGIALSKGLAEKR
jgi:O-antigen ligase